MEIFDYFSKEHQIWIDKIRACDWRAAKFLADLLEQNKFHNVLGNAVCLLWLTVKSLYPSARLLNVTVLKITVFFRGSDLYLLHLIIVGSVTAVRLLKQHAKEHCGKALTRFTLQQTISGCTKNTALHIWRAVPIFMVRRAEYISEN